MHCMCIEVEKYIIVVSSRINSIFYLLRTSFRGIRIFLQLFCILIVSWINKPNVFWIIICKCELRFKSQLWNIQWLTAKNLNLSETISIVGVLVLSTHLDLLPGILEDFSSKKVVRSSQNLQGLREANLGKLRRPELWERVSFHFINTGIDLRKRQTSLKFWQGEDSHFRFSQTCANLNSKWDSSIWCP